MTRLKLDQFLEEAIIFDSKSVLGRVRNNIHEVYVACELRHYRLHVKWCYINFMSQWLELEMVAGTSLLGRR